MNFDFAMLEQTTRDYAAKVTSRTFNGMDEGPERDEAIAAEIETLAELVDDMADDMVTALEDAGHVEPEGNPAVAIMRKQRFALECLGHSISCKTTFESECREALVHDRVPSAFHDELASMLEVCQRRGAVHETSKAGAAMCRG